MSHNNNNNKKENDYALIPIKDNMSLYGVEALQTEANICVNSYKG